MAERLVVIGGDAAGMAAAGNARRGRPDLEIVVIEKGRHTSYSACGIPYVVGGTVAGLDELVVRTPQEFRDGYRVDVRTRHEAMSIDLDSRRVELRALDQDRTLHLGFDQLHIATGARPRRPEMPGIEAPWIYGVQTLGDAEALLAGVAAGRCRTVVVVGGGYVGLEMAEAFINCGAHVTVVDAAPHPLRGLDPEFGDRVAEAMRRYGIDVRCGVRVDGFSDHVVHTSRGDLPADLVVLGTGVAPASAVAIDAGLAAGAGGAIAVDHRQRTSAEGIYAAGDCADTYHLVTRQRVHVALGTVANKTGRVAGTNIGGGYASFPGVVGTAVTQLCNIEIARTGLSEAEAVGAGIEYVTGTAEATSRAGYFPGAEPVLVKMLVERGRGRVLGGQIIGADRVGKRIDTVATAITGGLSVWDVLDLDLAYAPGVSPLWDPFQVAAQQAIKALGRGPST